MSYKLASNRKYISQAVNQKTGLSFTTLINKYRIDHAKYILKNYGTNVSAKRIARSAGFGSISSYHRVFKEITGQTPTEWLINNGEQEKEKSVNREKDIT